MIPFWTSAQTAANLPDKAYSPLEASSSYASKESGIPKGGISMVQILRYTDTPVGPYDELILCPGFFEYPVEDKDGKKSTKKAARITRIYVSQKQTCWNGRHNWNIPKHLARFEWTDKPDGSMHIKVFPHDTASPYSASEAKPSEKPFFQCAIKPISYTPAFPMSTALMKYMGIDMSLVQPPVPAGESELQELAGTERWCKLSGFTQSSTHAKLAWADMEQKDEDGDVADEHENYFFPGLRKWNIAVKMADATVFFPTGEHWATPRSLL